MVNSYDPIPDYVEKIATEIVDSAFTVHSELGAGLLESAYESCLVYELKDRGLKVKTQIKMPITYKKLKLEEGYRIDVMVEDCVIVEIKATDILLPVHKEQILTYLKFSGHRLGFLINFKSKLIKDGINRMVL